MYLTERLIALFTYALVLCIICFLISKLEKKYLGKVLFIYTLILTAMSFLYVPASGADLYRLIPIMHIWANLSYDELINEVFQSPTPVYILYMHFIGKTKVDALLPAITSFLFYSNVFYILRKSVQKFKVQSSDAALTLFFFMSLGVLIEVISGIRTMLGFSFVAVCVYKEMVEGRSIFKNIIWYVLASLLHPAVLVLTIIRFGFLIFEKTKNNYQRISKLLFLLFLVGTIYLGQKYLEASFEKAEEYIFHGTFSYLWEYVIGGISLVFIMYCIFLTQGVIKKGDRTNDISKLLSFCKYMAILLILVVVEYNTFHRLVIFLSIIAIPLLLYLLMLSRYQKLMTVNFRQLVFILSCLLLLIASARGNLTSLKFFIF